MNRRHFIESIMAAVAGTAVAYSFPSIIVPKNIKGFAAETFDAERTTEIISQAQRAYMEGVFKAYQHKSDFFTFFRDTERLVPSNYAGRQILLDV